MINREKVIKGLECCVTSEHGSCYDCPYSNKMEETCYSLNSMLNDALILLKAQDYIDKLNAAIATSQEVTEELRGIVQEPVKAVKRVEETVWNVCSYCDNHIISKWKWCPYCGRAVKWENED